MTSRHRLRCGLSDESGSLLVGLGLVGLAALLALGVGLVGGGIAAYAQASNAADAAALAAAPVTFSPFGAVDGPSAEADRFARMNGATLLRCSCPVDASWNPRTVEVVVARVIAFPVIGSVSIRATSRATFEPAALLSAPEAAEG